MYWFDTTVVVVLVVAALLGARCGFVGQIARTVSMAIAIYAAILFHEPCMQALRENALREANEQAVSIVTYGVVFLLTYLVLMYIVRMLREGVQESELDVFDRLFGAVLGTLKMAGVVGAICLAMATNKSPITDDVFAHSRLATSFADAMERVVVMVPEEYKVYLGEKVQGLREHIGK